MSQIERMNSNITPKCVLIYFGFHYILSEFGHFYPGKLVKPLVNEDQLYNELVH